MENEGWIICDYLTFEGKLKLEKQLDDDPLFPVFAMLTKLAKADGQVSKAEIVAVKEFMQEQEFDDDRRKPLIAIFSEMKDDLSTFEQHAYEFYRRYGAEQNPLRSMLYLLLSVACANQRLHAGQDRLLREAIRIFCLEETFYEKLKAECFPYAGREDSDEVVKKRYRLLVRQYHPDTLGPHATPEQRATHTKQFQTISLAYETIQEQRGLC